MGAQTQAYMVDLAIDIKREVYHSWLKDQRHHHCSIQSTYRLHSFKHTNRRRPRTQRSTCATSTTVQSTRTWIEMAGQACGYAWPERFKVDDFDQHLLGKGELFYQEHIMRWWASQPTLWLVMDQMHLSLKRMLRKRSCLKPRRTRCNRGMSISYP
ncbi:hypothetical protein Plhal710r2_c041g0141921 [Plasmopara halstedii]